ncbi:hypothetical protein [Endozoicomonas sp. 4G]|uniref:WD40 repeat domain-containing protein n=1 Tax=Endozoicomonas sp. 4G TaxID=2872754 RepID=UPI002078DD38|nr:hypothetical protein [Endozoicomonas sp. 4G]
MHSADWVWSVTFSPDDTQLITGGDDDTVNVFEGMSPFNHLQVLPEAKKDIRTVAINAQGTLLAAGGYDTDVRLYLKNRTNLFNHVKTLTNSSSFIEEIDFNPINGQIAVGERLRRVKTYSGISPYNHLKTLLDSVTQISAITYNPDGTLLTSGDAVRRVRFYNGTNPDNPLRTLRVPGHGQISRIAFNPNGTRMAVTQRDGKVIFFEGIDPFSHLYTLPSASSQETVVSLAYSCDGKWLVTGRTQKIMMYRVDGVRLPTTQAITSKAITTAVNTTKAVTETDIGKRIENSTKEYNSSTLTALSVVTLLTAFLQEMILQ